MKQKEINKKNKSYVGADDPVRPLPKRNPLIKQNGITVVALVITIIIMLILAGVTVKIATGGGIIDKTKNASDKFEIEQEKEKVKSGYLSYKTAKMVDDNAQLFVEDAQPPIGNATSGWTVIFTKTNNEYKLTKDGKVTLTKQNGTVVSGWTDNGDGTFTNGDVTLQVGDYVNYDPTKDENGNTVSITSYTSYGTSSANKNDGRSNGYADQVFNLNNYNSGWKVLGVDNGNIRLISADIIGSDNGADSSEIGKYLIRGKDGYQYGISELNAISTIYGQGKGATGAKSITVEDINKITGYNPTNTGNGKPYGSGEAYEYGNKITYFWDGTNTPYYEYGEGVNKITGSLGIAHNVFDWYEGTIWRNSAKSTTATATNKERIVELTNNFYGYYPTTLTNNSAGAIKGIEEKSNVWELLFGNTDSKYYMLASTYVSCDERYVSFGIHMVNKYNIDGAMLAASFAYEQNASYGIRPVVTLKSDVQIEKTSANDGTTLNKACIIK